MSHVMLLFLVFFGWLNNATSQSYRYNPLTISAGEVRQVLINGEHLLVNVRGISGSKEFKIEVSKRVSRESEKEFFEDWDFFYENVGGSLNLIVKGSADKSRLQQAYRGDGRYLPQFQVTITGPSRPLSIYSRLGNTTITSWEENLSVVNQGGKVHLTDLKAQARVLLMSGEFSVAKGQGEIAFESYNANSSIYNFEGKIKSETFSGSHKLAQAKGVIDWFQQNGKLDISNSKAQMDFRVGSASVQIDKFDGDVRGQLASGSLKVNVAGDINLRVNSVDGPVNIHSQQSSASINVGSKKGEIYGPSYLKTQQWSNIKTMTGRLRGGRSGGSVFVRSDNANIRIR